MRWSPLILWIGWWLSLVFAHSDLKKLDTIDENAVFVWLSRQRIHFHANVNFSCTSLKHYRVCPSGIGELMRDLPDILSLKLTHAQGNWNLRNWGYMRSPMPIGLALTLHTESRDFNKNQLARKLSDLFGITSELFKEPHLTLIRNINLTQKDLLYMSLPRQRPRVQFTKAIIDLLPCKNKVLFGNRKDFARTLFFFFLF
jgi:hypothetical protein